ncbi:MAG: cytochrome P450 [Acidobacteria bacterium]|nr:MAG: cytochrome P450 [Acidobacteriota bacterium]REK10552.1 MAG: cytochrome P450 [Acidobacteriota bacterium]
MTIAEHPSAADESRAVAASTPFLDQANRLSAVPNPALRGNDSVPGDDGRPVVGHTLDFVRDARALVHGMAAEHGPNFRLRMFGHPVFVVGHPDAVRTVLMDAEKNFSSRLGWQHAIGELFARGLMLRDFEEHRVHRKIMQIAFRADAMRGYVDMMNPLIERGLDGWSGRDELRFYDAIKQLTLDLGAAVFVGTELGAEADRINEAFVDSVQASIAIVKREVPLLSYRRGMQGRRLLERFFAERIPERREGDGRDMFSEFCHATTEDGDSFDDQQIVDHMIFLLMAAHDTTTSSLTSMAWALAQYPEWQERLRREMDAVEGRYLSWSDRDALEQTSWVFKEALRLFPPVPFIGRRAVRDCELGGVQIPANSAINVCSLVTHYLGEFWTRPFDFDPERFSRERREDKRHSHSWYAFGGGAHTCLGMHFADLQVKAFLLQFLRRFRIELPPGYQLRMRPIPIPKPSDGLPLRLHAI